MEQVASRALLHASFFLGLLLNPKNGSECSSQTSIDIQRTTLRYIPEDITRFIKTGQWFRAAIFNLFQLKAH
jgi:hypothetical protein